MGAEDVANEILDILGGAGLAVDIKKEILGEDPAMEVFLVVVTNAEDGVWTERYTKERLGPFLRGLVAAGALMGFMVDIPNVYIP